MMHELAASLSDLSTPELRRVLIEYGLEVSLREDRLLLTFRDGNDIVEREMPARIVRRGSEKRLVLGDAPECMEADPVLLKLVAQAWGQRKLLADPAHPKKFSKRHRWQLLRIAFLAPDIISAIVEGRQPTALLGRRLLRATDVPLDWAEQRRFFGFA